MLNRTPEPFLQHPPLGFLAVVLLSSSSSSASSAGAVDVVDSVVVGVVGSVVDSADSLPRALDSARALEHNSSATATKIASAAGDIARKIWRSQTQHAMKSDQKLSEACSHFFIENP